MNLLGKRLRTLRKSLELSQESLGVLIGLDESCSRTRISRYESGIHEPSFSTAKLLAHHLQVPIEYLYCERDLVCELILLTHQITDEEIELLIEYLKNIIQLKINAKTS